MRVNKTAIISANRIMASGLSHCIKRMATDPEIDFFDSIPAFIKSRYSDYFILILDSSQLANPRAYSTEKLYQRLQGTKLVTVSENIPPKSMQPFLAGMILFSDSQEQILNKMQAFYEPENAAAIKKSGGGILSERETGVLRLVALGHSNKEISQALLISTHTVITHRKNITSKLGIKTIAGLTVYSILNGIITTEDLNFS